MEAWKPVIDEWMFTGNSGINGRSGSRGARDE